MTPIFSYNLKLSAIIHNNGDYRVDLYYYYFRIDAVSEYCNWVVTSDAKLSTLGIYSLEPDDSDSFEWTFSFVPNECSCMDTLSDLTLRFRLFPSTSSTVDQYFPYSFDIALKVDCSLFPFLPALAFYIRPHILDVNPWCVDDKQITVCQSNSVKSLILEDDWYVYAKTHLTLGDVENPPQQYKDIDLTSFPLPKHDFYLISFDEAPSRTSQVHLSAVSTGKSNLYSWQKNDNDNTARSVCKPYFLQSRNT